MPTDLEKEMAALMASTEGIMDGAKEAQKTAARARRKSRDLQDTLDSIDTRSIQGFNNIVGRSRRKSREFTLDDLKSAFNDVDKDGSGKLNREELRTAIQKADPTASEERVDEMINFADKNNDGEIDFDEFTKAVMTKPDPDAAAAPAQ